MINIRSITVGIALDGQSKLELTSAISNFMSISQTIYNQHDIKIRTTRLALEPINLDPDFTGAFFRSALDWISAVCNNVGIRWFCVPFDCSETEDSHIYSSIAYETISRHQNAFVNFIVARDGKIGHSGVAAAANLISRVSTISNNGFDNFRVGVSCDCRPHTPFFPFSYHDGDNGFSVALETVDMFLNTIESEIHNGIEAVQTTLLERLTDNLILIDKLGRDIERQTGMKFLGIDASLAPFPNGDTSVAKIVEKLGVEDFGANGSLFFTSFLTNIIKMALFKSNVRYVGFNGVMYSLLEDDYLAKRARQKNFNIDSLMLYSTVCGCGIDMVPVPGDILEEEIAAMIMDVSSLAITLNKPLGVRILPIPGKKGNELTGFNYDFLVDTRIMNVRDKAYVSSMFNNEIFEYIAKQ